MAYDKQTWQTGDTVTSAKLNHMEDGIAAGGSGGGVLAVNATVDSGTGLATLDKTWQEINDAPLAVIKMSFGGEGIDMAYVSNTDHGGAHYTVSIFVINQGQVSALTFDADSADGYPSTPMD